MRLYNYIFAKGDDTMITSENGRRNEQRRPVDDGGEEEINRPLIESRGEVLLASRTRKRRAKRICSTSCLFVLFSLVVGFSLGMAVTVVFNYIKQYSFYKSSAAETSFISFHSRHDDEGNDDDSINEEVDDDDINSTNARKKGNVPVKPVYFDDVAGVEEAKAELWELVDYLREPCKYRALGARMPKGVLLVGPPGSGKTMLARAVATEAAAHYVYTSGSEFIEIFVGQGARRIRELFAYARARQPCIIFIDELDSVGAKRSGGGGSGGQREHDQTLNQLLVEMDGFNSALADEDNEDNTEQPSDSAEDKKSDEQRFIQNENQKQESKTNATDNNIPSNNQDRELQKDSQTQNDKKRLGQKKTNEDLGKSTVNAKKGVCRSRKRKANKCANVLIVLAATNRLDVLDSALLRPGRFDRVVHVPLPDVLGREQILLKYAGKLPVNRTEVSHEELRNIARVTAGFSGAELENMLNEAALMAARRRHRFISLADIHSARDKVAMGPERKSVAMSLHQKTITAFHEAGHALVAFFLQPVTDPIHKATIISRGQVLGFVEQIPPEDRYGYAKSQLEGRLAVTMGGRTAEEIKFGKNEVSNGASSDILTATRIAYKMVCEWGMSDKLGPLNYNDGARYDFVGDSIINHRISGATASMIENEVRSFVDNAMHTAHKIIRKYRNELEKLATALLEYETLGNAEITNILDPQREFQRKLDSLNAHNIFKATKNSLGKSVGNSNFTDTATCENVLN